MILNESGVVYEYKYDYKEAVNRYTMSMHLAEKAGDSLSVSYSLSNIAGVYVIEKNTTWPNKTCSAACVSGKS